MNNEREIQYVKPNITQMRSTASYMQLKMERMQQMEVFDTLCAISQGKKEDNELWYHGNQTERQ